LIVELKKAKVSWDSDKKLLIENVRQRTDGVRNSFERHKRYICQIVNMYLVDNEMKNTKCDTYNQLSKLFSTPKLV
jgi:hypothetical protein